MNNKEREKLRARRLVWPVKAQNPNHVFHLDVKAGYGFRRKILSWISTHTEGEFYLNNSVLYFVEEKDAMVFQLYKDLSKLIND